ncbi:MAG: F0F1 ATP synthase subunit A [Chloroflexota bacterium]|nr:F0F1 ATP synthase subunit A [Chloroflexota bacterium]
MLWQLPDLKLAPDVIFYIGPMPVTNTLLCTWLTAIVLFAIFYFGARKRALIPGRFQSTVEYLVEFMLGLVDSVMGSREKGKKFFPLVATFFLFILFANLLDIFPGVDTIGQIDTARIQADHAQGTVIGGFLLFGGLSNKIIPWIRPATSDINLTLSMALISVIVTQIFGFIALGPGVHIGKYLNFRALFTGGFGGFIQFFVGIVEIISELARIISFSFRLFGNIFAGSAVLAVFAFLLPFAADIIFIPFELFVAFVQALVFALLTLVFMQIATSSHEHVEQKPETGEFVEKGEPTPLATH